MMPLKGKGDFCWNQKVSAPLSFLFLILLSTLVAWITIVKAQEVIASSRQSAAFNIEKRIDIERVRNVGDGMPVTEKDHNIRKNN